MAAPVIWFEVLGKDGDKLRQFYGKLFDWEFKVDPKLGYGTIDHGAKGIPGGIGRAPQGPGWVTFYVEVPDPGAALAEVERLGGKVLLPVTEVADVTIAVAADPEGHPVGLVKS